MTESSFLTVKEREGRWSRVREVMKKQGFDCLVVWGSNGSFGSFAANMRYLSAISDMGYLVFPLEGEPTTFTFEQGLPGPWVKDNRVGHPKYSKAISQRLRELHLEKARIGIVGISGYLAEMGFPYVAYKSLMDNFPGARFDDATGLLERVRRIKSDAEIRIIEAACEAGSRVIQAIVDTAGAGVKDYKVRLKIMDTLFMEGCEPDFMLLYHSGKEGVHAAQGGWAQPPGEKVLQDGEVILMEFDAKYLGYRAQFNQSFAVGEPDKEWAGVFRVAAESFDSGFRALKSGITAGELDEAFMAPINKAGYVLRNPAFHGQGLSIEMPVGFFEGQPEYKPDTSFVIEDGMVLELEPHIVSSDEKKGIHIGSLVLVTETGCRLLTRDWKPEFKIVRGRASGS